MTKDEKLLQKFLSQPTSVKYSKIEKILINFGFTKKQGKGSHQIFKHEKLEEELIFAVHNNDCKEVYKRYTAKIIKEYFKK